MTINPPLYGQVYESLLNQISNGELPGGSRIPTDSQLAQHFRVSRITIKKALELLTAQGYITRTPRRGTFVADNIDKKPPLRTNIHWTQTSPVKVMNQIGLILPEFGDSYGLDLLSSIERTAYEHNVLVSIGRSYSAQEEEQKAILRMVELGVKGLIIFPVNGSHYNREIVRLQMDGFPIVLVDKYLPGIPVSAVTTDNYDASKQLTSHLLELGHRHIAFFSPPMKGTVTLEERFDGFMAAMRQYGVPILPDGALSDFPSDIPSAEDEGYAPEHMDMILKYLESHPEVTAIYATEFQVAAHVLRATRMLNLRVPEDLSIVCFDSLRTNLLDWNFTHVRQDETTMGRTAVESLLSTIDGQIETQSGLTRVPGRLVRGNSDAQPCGR